MNNNQLIAEFMGYQNVRGPKEYPLYKIPEHAYEVYDYEQSSIVDTFSTFFDDMQFKTSWNWIMPVVEKIESLETIDKDFKDAVQCWRVEIFAEWCCIKYASNIYGWTDFIEEKGENKMEALYSAVIKFIEAYNDYKS
jgi:hypothetical protein